MRAPGCASSVTAKSRPAFDPHEPHGVMPLAEPDANTVRELPLERLPACAIKADRTDRRLDGHPAGFVERRQGVSWRRACHRGVAPHCHARRTGACRSSKWHSLRVSIGMPQRTNRCAAARSPNVTWPWRDHAARGFASTRHARSDQKNHQIEASRRLECAPAGLAGNHTMMQGGEPSTPPRAETSSPAPRARPG